MPSLLSLVKVVSRWRLRQYFFFLSKVVPKKVKRVPLNSITLATLKQQAGYRLPPIPFYMERESFLSCGTTDAK